MSIKQDEIRTYNLALKTVEDTNKRLYALYKESLRKAENEIISMQMKLLRDGKISPYKEARLVNLINKIKDEIKVLRTKSDRIVQSGYIENYERTYYYQSFSIEKAINIKSDISYFLNTPELNKDVIMASFNKRVAGTIFRDRTLRTQREMQYLIQDAVAQNVIEGQSVKSLAKNLDLINDVYEKGLGNTTTIARTELLKAYSIGNDTARIEAEKAGVEFAYEWNAALDGKTRIDHAMADKQKAIIIDGQPIFNVGGVQFIAPRMPLVETGSKAEAGQVINCRCMRLDLPFGVEPTTRIAKKASGEWETVNSNITAKEWTEKEYGKSY